MHTIRFGRIGMCIGMMFVVNRAFAATEPWRTVDQPDLKQAVEKAPTLPTESFGEPARGVKPREHDLVPNPDGRSWDVIEWYQEYGPAGRQQLYIIDPGTGEVKMQTVPPPTPIYTAGRALGFDGNLVGRNLSTIGQIRTERDLLESILFPNATLARDYEAHAINTTDGQSLVAVIRRMLPEAIVVADGGGQELTLPRAKIASMQILPTSLMPFGLDHALTEEELIDLIAYLRSCR